MLGEDTDELNRIQSQILRALTLGLLPMLVLSLAVAATLGRRTVRRIAALG